MTPTQGLTLGFLGCGYMGRALLSGFLSSGIVHPDSVIISARSTAASTAETFGVRWGTPEEVIREATVILLAIKPQQAPDYLPHWFSSLDQHSAHPPLIISLLAGVNVSQLERLIGHKGRVIRVMPNLPASVGLGVTLAHVPQHFIEPSPLSSSTQPSDRQRCELLFRGVGHLEWIEDESDMHAATAISGSGPAYVFMAIEALADAGVALGLKRAVAQRLAAHTIEGSGAMAKETSPASLKDRVTSPGGVTIQGVRCLEKNTFRSAWIEAVIVATERSREMERP